MILDERTLPTPLQKDINALREAREELKKNLDNENIELMLTDLWCELYGSINASQYGYEIDEEVADYLRNKYLY